MRKTSREAYWFFFISNCICQTPNTINCIFLFAFWICYYWIMTIPLLLSWWTIHKPRKYYVYVVSSVVVLLFSGFDIFHAQRKIGMVCRTLDILTLPCYLILNNMMLDLTGRGCSKGESTMVGTVFDAPVTCCYEVILMLQYFTRVATFL